jgi:hypothetical protein
MDIGDILIYTEIFHSAIKMTVGVFLKIIWSQSNAADTRSGAVSVPFTVLTMVAKVAGQT